MGKIFYIFFLLLCFAWEDFLEGYIENFRNILDETIPVSHLLLVNYIITS